MNSLIRPFTLAFLLFLSAGLISQDVFQELDKVYGLDPLLYNGRKYSYFLPAEAGGTQFLYSPEFGEGELKIRCYGDKVVRWDSEEGFMLNYDVLNQKLLLKYQDETGAAQIIEVPDGWLESFSLGEDHFRCLDFDGESRIYQVLGDGKYQVLYAWRKTLKLNNSPGAATFSFSPPAKACFVLQDGQLLPYGSNGSFVKNFDPALKEDIKKYMQTSGVSVKKANNRDMTGLINYISNLK